MVTTVAMCMLSLNHHLIFIVKYFGFIPLLDTGVAFEVVDRLRFPFPFMFVLEVDALVEPKKSEDDDILQEGTKNISGG